MATGMFENDAGGNCLQQQPPPGVPDSPDSIPLPDSPPPEAEERGQHQGAMQESVPPDEHNKEEENETLPNPTDFVASNNSSHNPQRGSRKSSSRKPRIAEEYDPSEPLTSSDEEEHSIQLIEGGSRKSNSSSEFKNTRSEPRKSNSSSSNSNSGSNCALELGRSTSPKPYKLSSTPPPSGSSVSRTLTNKPLSPKAAQEQRPAAINSNSSSNSSNNVSNVSNNNRLDLNSIPVPPEENRRPVIHFSIPTRHKLLPISSLIKRQKGNAKKDGRSDAGNGQQSEPNKGLDRGQEGDDEDDEDDLDDCNRPKISLVAEIFGNDDDDDDENEEETDQFQQTSVESKNKNADDLRESMCGTLIGNTVAESDAQQQNTDKAPITQIDSNSGRWKIVADEANVPLSITDAPAANPSGSITTTPAAESPKAVLEPPKDIIDTTEDEPEIIEIVTINVPTNNRLRPLRRRPFLSRLGLENGGEPEVIEIDQNDDDEVPLEVNTSKEQSSASKEQTSASKVQSSASKEQASASKVQSSASKEQSSASKEQSSVATNVPPPVRQPSPPPSPVAEAPKESNRERMLRPVDSSPERERHFKRPHSSSSMSNCEEGEIIDQVNPSKKRRKDKKKKTKKRKRSKDSVSPPKLAEKRLSDNNPPPASSDHEDSGGRNAISWRKPSKRSQNRNYRDGKPKADDTFFREKEAEDKRRSDSPRRNRPAGRNKPDKSPNREKSGKLRREGSARNRSHSKTPGAKDSRSRSRSGGRPYRSRRRNRHSRSKSTNSLSDKSRSGRSSSRRRSRRRYRRSNSRHRVGDSRSPSYITEPIRSRSSHYSKLRDRSRSRSRDRHTRGRHRKHTMSRSRSVSLSRAIKKNKNPESLDRQQRKKQIKEKEKPPFDCGTSDAKEKRKEKEKLKEKEKEKRKKKEKPKEEEKVKPKEKVKEKEKRKKRKRREKSPTPVKAIVADGDSIVVSLSFQKGKTAASSSNAQPSVSTEHRKETGMDTSENSEPTGKQLGKGNSEPPQDNEFNDEAEHSQNSPAKLSSVTDEEGNISPVEPCPTERSKSEEKETEAVKVTSTGGGSTSPFEAERSFSAAADSTKIVTPQQSEQLESSFSHSRSSMSPTDVESNAQGDSLVTSTGDSMDPPVTDESSKSNSSSTPSKQIPGLSHKISTSAVSPRFQATQTTTSTESTVVPSASTALTSTTASNSQNSVTPTRPLIGNIPGLYPSSAIISSGGAAPVPPPIVIPTPPPPQGIRFSGSSASAPMLNPNVLASVASALLAVRQNQPGKIPGTSGMGCSDTSNSQLRHVNVLGPRTQNFNLQSNARHSGNNFSQGQDQGGDSPMSPNSSDGDDLFEPPTERSQGDTNGNGKLNKNGQHLGNASLTGNVSNAPNKPKERGLFDTLFGNPEPKKTAANKPEKTKSKGKHNRKGAKKETIKVNTSGGLTEGELRLTDEVPTSAVELIVKQKYLKKLNRQERVVEEVKLSLKPYYSKRQVNKDEYKEILRRAVPKICHNKTGEINPGKIKELVEAYVKKFRHARKRGVDISNIN